MLAVYDWEVSKHFGTYEDLGYNSKIFVNFAGFFTVVFGPKFFNTSHQKFVNTLKPKCVDSSCKQSVYCFVIFIDKHWDSRGFAPIIVILINDVTSLKVGY